MYFCTFNFIFFHQKNISHPFRQQDLDSISRFFYASSKNRNLILRSTNQISHFGWCTLPFFSLSRKIYRISIWKFILKFCREFDQRQLPVDLANIFFFILWMVSFYRFPVLSSKCLSQYTYKKKIYDQLLMHKVHPTGTQFRNIRLEVNQFTRNE